MLTFMRVVAALAVVAAPERGSRAAGMLAFVRSGPGELNMGSARERSHQ